MTASVMKELNIIFPYYGIEVLNFAGKWKVSRSRNNSLDVCGTLEYGFNVNLKGRKIFFMIALNAVGCVLVCKYQG